MCEADDATLVREYRQTGRLDYLAALYERYMDLVYGVCLKYLDEESSKDAGTKMTVVGAGLLIFFGIWK